MRDPFIKVPFASGGDKSSIPDATQPSGSISMQSGWGVDYEKEVGVDPAAKSVNRQDMNQVLYLATALLNRWQTESFPEFIDSTANGGSPYPYPIGAIVRFPNGSDFVLRSSLQNNNISTPSATAPTSQWGDPTAGFNLSQADNGMLVVSTPGVTSWTVPKVLKDGVKKAYVTVVGAGGSCAAFGATLSRGAAGGGASEGFVDLTGVTTVSITVGASVAAGNGGASSFGGYMSASGGGAGQLGPGAYAGGGSGTGGALNREGAPGGGPDTSFSGEGGASPYSVGAPRSSSGIEGKFPGGGSGAGSLASLGATGAVIIRW